MRPKIAEETGIAIVDFPADIGGDIGMQERPARLPMTGKDGCRFLARHFSIVTTSATYSGLFAETLPRSAKVGNDLVGGGITPHLLAEASRIRISRPAAVPCARLRVIGVRPSTMIGRTAVPPEKNFCQLEASTVFRPTSARMNRSAGRKNKGIVLL
jgi:hypothetical protein